MRVASSRRHPRGGRARPVLRCSLRSNAVGDENFYKRIWKSIKKKNECQTDMFIGVCVFENREDPPLFALHETFIRSDTVHNEFIPRPADTAAFDQSVITKIQEIVACANERHCQDLQIIISNTAEYIVSIDKV